MTVTSFTAFTNIDNDTRPGMPAELDQYKAIDFTQRQAYMFRSNDTQVTITTFGFSVYDIDAFEETHYTDYSSTLLSGSDTLYDLAIVGPITGTDMLVVNAEFAPGGGTFQTIVIDPVAGTVISRGTKRTAAFSVPILVPVASGVSSKTYVITRKNFTYEWWVQSISSSGVITEDENFTTAHIPGVMHSRYCFGEQQDGLTDFYAVDFTDKDIYSLEIPYIWSAPTPIVIYSLPAVNGIGGVAWFEHSDYLLLSFRETATFETTARAITLTDFSIVWTSTHPETTNHFDYYTENTNQGIALGSKDGFKTVMTGITSATWYALCGTDGTFLEVSEVTGEGGGFEGQQYEGAGFDLSTSKVYYYEADGTGLPTPNDNTSGVAVGQHTLFTCASIGISFGEEKDPNYIDFASSGTSTFESFFDTGYAIRAEGHKDFQTNYITTYSKAPESFVVDSSGAYVLDSDGVRVTDSIASSCLLIGKWDWSRDTLSGRWTPEQQIYNNIDRPFRTVQHRKLKLRGSGSSLQLHFKSEEGKPFHIVGWSTFDTAKEKV
jgi:hypothetical protein